MLFFTVLFLCLSMASSSSSSSRPAKRARATSVAVTSGDAGVFPGQRALSQVIDDVIGLLVRYHGFDPDRFRAALPKDHTEWEMLILQLLRSNGPGLEPPHHRHPVPVKAELADADRFVSTGCCTTCADVMRNTASRVKCAVQTDQDLDFIDDATNGVEIVHLERIRLFFICFYRTNRSWWSGRTRWCSSREIRAHPIRRPDRPGVLEVHHQPFVPTRPDPFGRLAIPNCTIDRNSLPNDRTICSYSHVESNVLQTESSGQGHCVFYQSDILSS